MILAFCLLIAGAFQDPAPGVVVDPAIQAAVERFYETQEKEDIDGYLSLWSAEAVPPRVEQLKFIFDSGDDKFTGVRVTRATQTGDRIRVRVEVQRERTSPARVAGGPPFVTTMAMRVALAFVKEGDDWKLVREGPAADDLAAEMMEAATDADRDALLAAESDLLGPPLLAAFARLGGAASVTQNYPQAQKIYEQLLAVARRGGFRKEEGEALQNIANALYFQRRLPEALTAYQERLTLERERGDEAGVAAALTGVATIRYSFAEYSEALARYREALAMQERLDDVAGIAFIAISIGNIAYLQGDYHAAIAAYRRSLELNRTMAHADGETRALEGLGRVYMAQGDYSGALDVFDTVLRDKRIQTIRSRLGSVAQNLGEVYFRLGNLEAARSAYEQSRGHFEAMKDLPNVGRVLQGLALTELAAGRFPPAEDLYKRSGAICSAAGDDVCTAAASAGLGFAQIAQDRFWEAAASYRTAIGQFARLGKPEESARSEVGLAQALTGAGDYAGGIGAATRARHAALSLGNDDVMWRALIAEARAIRQNGDRPRALGVAQAAMSVLERLQNVALDKPGSSLTSDASAALATFAILQAETGDAKGAFATSERLHAMEIRGGLATNERDIARGMTDEQRDQERTLAAQLVTRIAQLSREKGLPKPDRSRLAALETAVAEATAARRTWLQSLYEALPQLRVWRGLGPSRELTDASRLVLDRGEIVLSFVLDEDDVLALAIARDEIEGVAVPTLVVEAHAVPIKRRQVAAAVIGIQQAAVLGDGPAWRKAIAEIAAMVPERISARLGTASKLVVIPHDVLWRVPFEALPSGNGFVADHATVTLGGSLDALVRSHDVRSAAEGPLVAVAAPDIDPRQSDRLRQLAAGWTVREAGAAAAEMKAVSAAYGADRVTALSGRDASEPAVRENLSTTPAVHIAAPLRINAASPLFSPILLSVTAAAEVGGMPDNAATTPAATRPVTRPAADDGVLELREVMNLDSKARVVVFSDGGATAMRDGAAAADVLQWGWLAAGVPSLLVARWSAPALSNELLLAEFYRQLQAGMQPSAALRAAQQHVREKMETAAPIHWAGWLLLGAR